MSVKIHKSSQSCHHGSCITHTTLNLRLMSTAQCNRHHNQYSTETKLPLYSVAIYSLNNCTQLDGGSVVHILTPNSHGILYSVPVIFYPTTTPVPRPPVHGSALREVLSNPLPVFTSSCWDESSSRLWKSRRWL